MKKFLLLVTGFGVSALTFAQESTGLDLNAFLGSLKTETEGQVESMLPILGEIATVGIVLFLALWAFRAVKRFLGR